MQESVWKQLRFFFSLLFTSPQDRKDVENGQASEILFDNLKSFTIGKFEEESELNLDAAIRQKQAEVFKKLQLEHFDSFLEIDAEWGLLSHSFASQFGIVATAVFSSEAGLRKMQQLNSMFIQYRNIRILHINDCKNVIISNYYNAVHLSNSFFETCSYFQWTAILARLQEGLSSGGRMFLEFVTCSRYSADFVQFILFSKKHFQKPTVLFLFSTKYVVHSTSQAGFLVECLENVSKDAERTIRCYLANIKRRSKECVQRNAHLIRYYELKLQAFESGSISAWNLFLSKVVY